MAVLALEHLEVNMDPHAHHFVYSLPPEGASVALGRPGGNRG